MRKIKKNFTKDRTIHVGTKLRYYRKAYGLTQVALAEVLGLHQSAVARIELGQQQLTIPQLCWFCDTFNIKITDICWRPLGS